MLSTPPNHILSRGTVKTVDLGELSAPQAHTRQRRDVKRETMLLWRKQNAVDAMIDRPDRDRGIEIAARAVDGAVEVEVRDHGPGLDEAVAAHLFEPFFTTKPQGLGLGLSICRTIVESHGGRLSAANRPDGGLAMRFALPIDAEDPTGTTSDSPGS